MNLLTYNIGLHIKKDKTFHRSLTTIIKTLQEGIICPPLQIFTASPKNWRRPALNEEDLIDTEKLITEHNISCYIHSMYLINLAKFQKDIPFAFKALKYDFDIGKATGMKGVVIHCGKSVKLDKSVAVQNMFDNCCFISENFATKEVPLLIETPAGQGTELLTTITKFSDFYDRFSTSQKKNIKLCVDTCHVFAAGHDPLDYLIRINTLFPKAIVLVHFNDSKCPKGCKKDRHEFPGEGYIGLEKMTEIAVYCNSENIPMVYE